MVSAYAVLLSSLMAASSVEAFSPPNSGAKPYSQDMRDNFNVLKHTTNTGPWSQGRGYGLSRDPPLGCRVDQVAMVHRHGERFPTTSDLKSQMKVLSNLKNSTTTLTGSLEFVNNWISYWEHDSRWVEELTAGGPYSGMLNARNRGSIYRARYGNLYDEETVLPIFTAGFQRVTDTGRLFGMGFLGYNYTTSAAVQIIPEVSEQGANNIAPQCKSRGTLTSACSDSSKWEYEEFKRAAARLNAQNNLNLTTSDIRTLMAIATYELNIRGDSPWLAVFSDEEWIAYEYYVSTGFYCAYGPGSNNVRQMAYPYLNSTRTLFNQGPNESLPLIFSFTHDAYTSPIVAALNLTHGSDWESYDPTKVTFGEKWDITDIVPQGGHLVMERLVCESPNGDDMDSQLYAQYPLAFPESMGSSSQATYASNYTYPGVNTNVISTGEENIYVRFVLNEAVLPQPDCNDGPGKSCKLSEFNKLIDRAIAGVNFNKDCGSPDGAADYLDFYWNWNNTNAYNPLPDVVSRGSAFLDWQGNPITI